MVSDTNLNDNDDHDEYEAKRYWCQECGWEMNNDQGVCDDCTK